MKSTKIEDILIDETDEIEEPSEINETETETKKDDDVQGELHNQLEILKSELSSMKKDTTENNVKPTIQSTIQLTDNIVKNSQQNVEAHENKEEVGFIGKFIEKT